MTRSPRLALLALCGAVPVGLALAGAGAAQDLRGFAVVAGETLTNTGPTTIFGDIAVSPGTAYTGMGSVTQTGATFLGDAVAQRMQIDLAQLYIALAARPTSIGGNLTGQDLGNRTLLPGVYNFDTSAGLAAGRTLILDADGDPDAVFIFNIGTTFVAGSGSSVMLQNGAQGGNVFYRVGSSATLDTSARIEGQIVAMASITMNTSAQIVCGAALARSGAVTLDTNTIRICTLAARGFDAVAADPRLTADQRAVALALSGFVAGGGTLPAGFAILAATQTPAELALTLSQLSGAGQAEVAPMAFRSMHSFLDAVMASGRTPAPRAAAAPRDAAPTGMVTEKIHTPYGAKYGFSPAAVSTAGSPAAAPDVNPWTVWTSAYGTRSVTDADPAQGAPAQSGGNTGFAVGVNVAAGPGRDFGLALSWDRADFARANAQGSGVTETALIALRGRSASARGYVEGALAYGRGAVTTDRTVTLAGFDRLTGTTTADTFAGHVEAGYHIGRFTPFAALRGQSHSLQGYRETAATGADTYALRYDTHTTTSLRSELGVDMRWPGGNPGGPGASVWLRAAWAHEFAADTPATRSFAAIPGVFFGTLGQVRDRDSLIVAATARLVSANGIFVDGAVRAELSRRMRDYGGSITVSYRW